MMDKAGQIYEEAAEINQDAADKYIWPYVERVLEQQERNTNDNEGIIDADKRPTIDQILEKPNSIAILEGDTIVDIKDDKVIPNRSHRILKTLAAMSRKKYGKPTMQLYQGKRSKKLVNYTPKLEARLEDDISKEVEWELSQVDNQRNWYTTESPRGMRMLMEKFPSLKEPHNTVLMWAITSVMSNGSKPLGNYQDSIDVYTGWEKSGVLPIVRPEDGVFGAPGGWSGMKATKPNQKAWWSK